MMSSPDRRAKPRVPYCGPIFFVAENQLYEGRLTNYNENGLFIETYPHLAVGTTITIALPYSSSENEKVVGQIIWRNRLGYGIELFREREAYSYHR
jgi:hypothetical protein